MRRQFSIFDRIRSKPKVRRDYMKMRKSKMKCVIEPFFNNGNFEMLSNAKWAVFQMIGADQRRTETFKGNPFFCNVSRVDRSKEPKFFWVKSSVFLSYPHSFLRRLDGILSK